MPAFLSASTQLIASFCKDTWFEPITGVRLELLHPVEPMSITSLERRRETSPGSCVGQKSDGPEPSTNPAPWSAPIVLLACVVTHHHSHAPLSFGGFYMNWHRHTQAVMFLFGTILWPPALAGPFFLLDRCCFAWLQPLCLVATALFFCSSTCGVARGARRRGARVAGRRRLGSPLLHPGSPGRRMPTESRAPTFDTPSHPACLKRHWNVNPSVFGSDPGLLRSIRPIFFRGCRLQHLGCGSHREVGSDSDGCGSKLNRRGYAGFGPCFHLPGFHFGTGFLSHRQIVGRVWRQCALVLIGFFGLVLKTV